MPTVPPISTPFDCALEQYLDMDTGMIVSPNHPNDYPNYADCSWYIRVGDGEVVQLTVIEFELENR